MSADCDLLVLAELNPDVVVACDDAEVRFGQVERLVEDATITLGSSGAITACAAAAQGLRVRLCAVVGDDHAGAVALEMLAAHGVDVSGVIRCPGLATGMTVVLTRPDGDRALLTFPGAMRELRAGDVDTAVLARARHVHASSFYLQRALQVDLAAVFAVAHRHEATTSVDPGWDPDEQWATIGAVLSTTDYLLPNAAECVRIAEALGAARTDVPEAAAALQKRGPAVVVKRGAEGALAIAAGASETVASGAVDVVDTTGAGDNFDAGFIAAVLDGAPLVDALARAVAAGSFSLSGRGGTGRLATRAEILDAAGLLS